MKRNESILVYGVTGLLGLILVVAVLFGKEGEAPARKEAAKEAGGSAESGVADLAGALNLDPAAAFEAAQDVPASDGTKGAAAEGAVAKDGAAPADDGSVPPAATPPQVLRRDDPVATPPAAWHPAPAPASEVVVVGADQKYRRVTVQQGDTFSTLVQRWCGSLDFMARAEALNEDVDPRHLAAGKQLLLPWVDDAELTEQHHEVVVDSARHEVATSHTYQVKDGENLWKIAVQATGSVGAAPHFIERVMQLNPGLVPERLRVGQEIVLPQD